MECKCHITGACPFAYSDYSEQAQNYGVYQHRIK